MGKKTKNTFKLKYGAKSANKARVSTRLRSLKIQRSGFDTLYAISTKGGVGLWLLFIGAFILFAVSTTRTISLEDDGIFVTAAWFAGVVHPPGYPLYTILGWLSSHLLPFGEIPWRVHLVSGFMGAVTCVCIAWLVLRRTGNHAAAYLAGAALAVSEHFWSQSIISDVYTMNTALLFGCVIVVQEAVINQDNKLLSTWLWLLAAFLYGLGLANHWPLLILASPLFVAYIYVSGKEFWRRSIYMVVIALTVAGLLYGWLAWRSHQAPPLNFLGSINSLKEMMSFIRRDVFSGADSQISAGFIDKIYYVWYCFRESFLQFSVVGGVLLILGAVHNYRKGWRGGFYSELATVITSSLLLVLLLDFDYESFRIAVFRPYPLVAYCVMALWLGVGIDVLMQAAGKWQRRVPPIVIYSSFAVIIVATGIYNGQVNYRANDRFAEHIANSLFDTLENNSILIPSGDAYIVTTSYYHLVEGKRADIRLLEPEGLLLNDRIVQPLWTKRKKATAWRVFAKNNDRPLYYQALDNSLGNQGRSIFGFLTKIDKTVAAGTVKLGTDILEKEYFKKMLALPPTRDAWINSTRNKVIKNYGNYLGYAIASNNHLMTEHIKDVLSLAENNYWSLIGMADSLSAQSPKYVEMADKYLQKAKTMVDPHRRKSNVANVLYIEGYIAYKKDNKEKARKLFIQSIEINPDKNNFAHKYLKKL